MFTLLLALIWPGLVLAQNPNARLLTTFTNPTPTEYGYFGGSVTVVGNDRVLIGPYLFTLNGTLLTTFTNFPAVSNAWPASVDTVGSDRVLIGPWLFNTNGTLLTTFANPNPASVLQYGQRVAALGSDRVLIAGVVNFEPNPFGAPGGVVFLFRTNGTLLTTFTNIAPAPDYFGFSLAVLGSDRILIGAPDDDTGATDAGVAYLFRTNGTLLTIFTNPIPVLGDVFGQSVAAMGSDRLLIGAPGYGGGVGSGAAGVAYLFSTNSTLLTTFTNPTPATYESFGASVAAVGSSRVLIGAPRDNTGAAGAGAAYLFSTNGTLLTTITNPTPAVGDGFGGPVVAVGTDRVLISASEDDTGATDSGVAYLFDLPYPPLSITRNAATVSLKWVTPEAGLALQQASLLGTPTVWSNTSDSVSINGLTNVVQQTTITTNRFFRLHRP
ncbi:MAG: hypothetical protein HOP33_11800 [Verrucomicrobia bacterium]|nr:hypothetical protein [Verrucomicrobiota bacterium]